jgi:hypothetical protein
MKKEAQNTELVNSNIAADVADQGTTGAGGKSDEEVTEEPCHVYVATLRGTEKIYIGITKRKVTQRWTEHCRETIKKTTKFGKALQEFGTEAFDWEWLGTFATRKEAGDFERHCTDKGLGELNTAPGGGGGYDTWTPLPEARKKDILDERGRWFRTRETREKTAASLRGRSIPNRKKQSEESIRKMVETKTGMKLSDETREKISKSLTGVVQSEEKKARISATLMGHTVSEESRLKMSCSRKGKEPWNKGKKVMTEEQKEHLRQVNLGKKASPETCTKISKSLTGQQRESPSQDVRDKISTTLTGNVPWNKGKDLSEVHCKNLSLSHRGKKQSPETIAKRTASRLATLARKKEEKLLREAMGPVITEVKLDG